MLENEVKYLSKKFVFAYGFFFLNLVLSCRELAQTGGGSGTDIIDPKSF